MSNAIFNIPPATNEPVLNYAPGSAERKLKEAIAQARSGQADILCI